MFHDQRLIEAISEETKKMLRGSHPEAAHALINMIRNPECKDHARAVLAVIDRTDPIQTLSHQSVEVTHKFVSPDDEALEELRALRQLGTPRAKLLELFGGNGLLRLEKLETADASRRADNAKVIDGEVIENG